MKKILITGANSYIGTSFERYLQQWSNEYVVDTIDMVDGLWRRKTFNNYDTVFHVAGLAHVKETKENKYLYYQINRDMAIETAQKAKAEGVSRYIFLSSMSVYGLDEGTISNKTIPQPRSHYGISKFQAEEGLKQLNSEQFHVVILRPPMVYGKGCKGNYLNLSGFARKFPFFPDINNKRSMLYIDNLCEFVRLMIHNDEQGTFFPQNADYVSTSQMVKLIAQFHGKKIHLTKIFNPLLNLLIGKVVLIDKVFGSLIYEQVMGSYVSDYHITDFTDSIKQTEGV